jgi:hypothetical protein
VRHSGIAIVVASALALAACGSSGSSPGSATKTTVPVSRKIVLTSITTTAAEKTARTDLEVSFSGGESGGSGRMTSQGVVDFGSGDSQMTMNIDSPLGSALGDGFETRTVDGVAYTRLPSGVSSLPLPAGKQWISIDTSKLGGDSAGLSPFDLSGQADPTKALAYLEKVSSDVREVGSETIRGTDTTHYHATIDLAKSVDTADVPQGMRESMKQLAGLFGTVPADVWIDADGRMRRERIAIDFGKILSGLGSGTRDAQTENAVMTETLDFYDFGTPVHVEAPPADQVVSLNDIGLNGGGPFGGSEHALPSSESS